jgi:transcriptional regulator with XRE-family HTH domain
VISQWENGHTMPTLLNAKRFCDCFGVSLDALVEGVE